MKRWQAPPKPADLAESRLIVAILEGHFPIGANLPAERDLAGRLGVTRPTLREALQRLARDGWIEIRHGRSTRVRNYWHEGNLGVLSAIARYPDHAPDDFVPNLLAVRRLMAPDYARQAVAVAAHEATDLLAQVVRTAGEPAALAQADWSLHHQLTVLSGNPIFTLILNGFAELYRIMAGVYFGLPETRDHSMAFYLSLLRAARAADALRAEQVTREAMTESLHLWQKAARRSELSAPGRDPSGEGES